MCGILGAFAIEGLDPRRCETALDLLRHRGPENLTPRHYRDDRLFLGHARLKVLDLSDDANQPFVSDCGNYEIVFNGEIFNFKALRAQIEGEFAFRTSGDTEVLLNLYRKYGTDMLPRLNGMFGFAIYDKPRNRLVLARDRFGIKPLYYTLHDGALCFASEIKPILHITGRAAPNERMIATYLATSHSDFGEETFFSDVRQLGAGHVMVFDLAEQTAQTARWYRLERKPVLDQVPEREVLDLVEERIGAAIDRHLVADVDVGLNVSGGVDSSTLIRFTTQRLGGCHGFTQDFKGYSERPWVEQVARGFPLQTHFAELGAEDIRAHLQKTVRHQEQPFGGVAVIGYSYLYEMARDAGVTVLLDGNGVDELFLGYKKYHLEYLDDTKGGDGFAALLADYCAFWQEPENVALDRIRGLARNSSMIDGTAHQGRAAMSRDLLSLEQYGIPTVDLFDDAVRNSAARDLLYTKIPRGLRFNDRMSMMHSRELRVPFLDHELVELAYALPVSTLINRAGTKAAVRKVLGRSVDAAIASAPKRSIQTPQNDWLAKDYRDLVEDVLASESFRGRGWVDVDRAKAAYARYLGGDRATSFFIWQWINLELWARTFFDEKAYA